MQASGLTQNDTMFADLQRQTISWGDNMRGSWRL